MEQADAEYSAALLALKALTLARTRGDSEAGASEGGSEAASSVALLAAHRRLSLAKRRCSHAKGSARPSPAASDNGGTAATAGALRRARLAPQACLCLCIFPCLWRCRCRWLCQGFYVSLSL